MKTKGTAAVLALFFGWLGLHRFYLGQLRGFLYIIFIFTFIPLVISWIEFIYFILMKKEDFDINYNYDYIKRKDYLQKSL